MERKYIVLGGIAAVMLIIGLLAINSIIGDEDAVVKKRPNFNISEVSHKVAVEKPETAILEQAAADISQKTTSEVTVYNQEFALIKDSREMELEKGVNLVEFKDIASKIDSTSVTFRDLSFPSTFVVEQNYEYDLVSTQKLLEKYLDKEITVQADEGESAKEYSGKLLSFKDGIVLQTAQGVVILPIYSKVQFPSLPGGLLTKPTLVWKVYSEDAGKRDTQTIYLTAGMGWKADYIAIVDGEDKQISLSGWTTITNNSGTSYPDAKLKLVAGDVHKVNESPKYEEAYDYAVRSTAAGAAPPAPDLILDQVQRLERHAAQDQAQQHRDQRRIQGWQDDGIGQRKGSEQAAAAQHQPGFVTVPYRRDAVHRRVAILPHLEQREEDADAKVEPIHHDIGDDRKADDGGPDDSQVDHPSPPSMAGAGVMPAVRIGAPSSVLSCACGGFFIRCSRYQMPMPNTLK